MPAGDGLLEDWPKEDHVRGLVAVAKDVGKRMAGDSNHGAWQAGLGVDGADLPQGEFARSGGQMDTMRIRGGGDVGPAVEEEPGRRTIKHGEQAAGKAGEFGGGKVFLAELKEVDAKGGKRSGLIQDVSPAL